VDLRYRLGVLAAAGTLVVQGQGVWLVPPPQLPTHIVYPDHIEVIAPDGCLLRVIWRPRPSRAQRPQGGVARTVGPHRPARRQRYQRCPGTTTSRR